MTYTWLIFDADGTLFDYDRAEATAFRRTFQEGGHPFHDEYADVYREVNGQIWREFEHGEITADDLRVERFARLFTRLALDIDPAGFSSDYLLNLGRQADLIDGAAEMVTALHDSLPHDRPHQRAEGCATRPAGGLRLAGLLRRHRHLRRGRRRQTRSGVFSTSSSSGWETRRARRF